MAGTAASSVYLARLRAGFWAYRQSRFEGQDYLFERRPEGDAVVFHRDHRPANLLIPPFATQEQREQIIGLIGPAQRHRHFGSMQSSQALAQSIFGAFLVADQLSILADIAAEDGQPAFGSAPHDAEVKLEKSIGWLGEKKRGQTSVDTWFGGPYRVAVECKLAEPDFGNCSRTELASDHPSMMSSIATAIIRASAIVRRGAL